MQTLSTVNETMGIWIHITQSPSTLRVVGNLSYSTDITLYPGWNLAGYPSVLTAGVSVDDLLNDPGLSIQNVEGYDGLNPPYHLKKLIPSYYLQPGEGYWLFVASSEPKVWSVPGF